MEEEMVDFPKIGIMTGFEIFLRLDKKIRALQQECIKSREQVEAVERGLNLLPVPRFIQPDPPSCSKEPLLPLPQVNDVTSEESAQLQRKLLEMEVIIKEQSDAIAKMKLQAEDHGFQIKRANEIYQESLANQAWAEKLLVDFTAMVQTFRSQYDQIGERFSHYQDTVRRVQRKQSELRRSLQQIDTKLISRSVEQEDVKAQLRELGKRNDSLEKQLAASKQAENHLRLDLLAHRQLTDFEIQKMNEKIEGEDQLRHRILDLESQCLRLLKLSKEQSKKLEYHDIENKA